jgi:hypothetical protein
MTTLQTEQQRRNRDSNHPEQPRHRTGAEPVRREAQDTRSRPSIIAGILIGGAILMAITVILTAGRSQSRSWTSTR